MRSQQVFKGTDLSGKTALITGGHFGLGFEATKALSAAGVHVVVGARDVKMASTDLSTVENVTILPLDLSDLTSVRSLAAVISANRYQLDYVLCNAGIMACPERRVGPGRESQFAINHLDHYALANLIWDNIRAGGGIICVSSAGHHTSPIRWDDVQFVVGYDKWLA